MELQQKFTTILEKERKNEIWAFLKGLDQTQKKAFTPFLKTTIKDYLDYRQVKENGSQYTTFMQKATPVQRTILAAAGFVCCTRQEMEKLFFGIPDEEVLDQVLGWYCPDWLNAFVNDQVKGDFVALDYLRIMKLREQGHIDPIPALIARQLPTVIHKYEGPNRNYQFTIDNLLLYDITLREHVWYLFQFESVVNFAGRYLDTDAAQKTWIDVFKEFSAAGKLDRQRILKEALLASNRGFNKTLSGWFAELFTALEPSTAELQTLQPELLMVLSAPHSKPVNTALQHLKKLADEKQLDAGSFLDHAGILFSSTTKAVLTNTLAVLEKLLKQDKQLIPTVCAALCQVFMNNDDDVQSRAAKLVKKYGNATDPVLREQIAQYRETMMVSARNLLPDFMEPVTATPVQENILEIPEAYNLLDEQARIEDISGFDELIFLASQAFDNNQPYHIYLLPAAVIRLHAGIKGEQVKKLEPAFQRAYKLVMRGTVSVGELDMLLAIFWIDYGCYLVQQFPEAAAAIRNMHESNVKQDEAFQQQSKWYTRRMRTMKEWSKDYKGDLCRVYLFFLITALDKITTGDTLPLLSTPTHAPGWLSPVELTDRLYQYQLANAAPDEMDLQMALSRLVLDTPAPALSYATEKLRGEYLRIMQFILEKDARPQPPFEHASWWMIAALTKTPLVIYPEFEHFPYNKVTRSRFTGQYAWQTIAEERFRDVYDYTKKKNVKEAYLHKELQVIGINKQEVQAATPHLLYEYITLGATESLFAAPNDMQRMLLFTPNNPEPLLAHVVNRCLQDEKFQGETEKKVVLSTIQALHAIQRQWDRMGHLFIATCLVSSDKTIAQIAAEIWINGVSRGLINSHQLGEVLGKHQVVEFTPLKRFTDLVMTNLIRLSDQHNRELEKMISSLLAQLPEEPVKNLKKLLEIYMEVLSINHSLITTAWIKEQLQAWSSNDGLSKVTRQLLTKYV